jgi:hypothetical protein
MTVRLAAALALLLGAVALMAYLNIMGYGPLAGDASRHLRAMKDRSSAPPSIEAVTLADILALPHRAPLATVASIERRGVMAEGYVQRMMRALDDDVHLELAPTPRVPNGPDTTYLTAEITPGWRAGSKRWSHGALEVAFRPNHGGTTAWDRGPRRVRVSGWLLYDYQYDAPPSETEQRTVAPRISGWEIHPVTRIELWDESLGRFVNLAR